MNGSHEPLVIGVDFGSLSGRALVVRASDGQELGSAVHDYRHAVMDACLTAGDRRPLGRDWALQNPDDYRDVLRVAVPAALAEAGADPADVVAIATDFTASTPLPVLTDGTPLCEVDGFRDEPHAYVKLWKHHAAQRQADRINDLARRRREPWLARYGGLVSSEWQFAKALEVFEEAPEVYRRMDHWVEAADWIVWQLCGTYVRNACTAGYKGIYQNGVHPSPAFLEELAPGFGGFVAEKLEHTIGELGSAAGRLTARAASWTGLPEGIVVAVGNVDAHVTAPAAQAVEPGQLVAIMGTSTCHIVNGEDAREVPGMCGVVDGGIVRGLWGYEAGQSGVGDILGWFVDNCVPGHYRIEAAAAGQDVHEYLSALAERQHVGEHGLLALDWHSGNRSILVDHALSGVMVGQTIRTRPEDQYRALVEATAYGTRTIVEAFTRSGVVVREFIAAGGLLKNRFLMQVYADVLGVPISTIGSSQGPALGSAIHAAVAAGLYPDVHSAARAMGRRVQDAYVPNPEASAAYDRLFARYAQLHDWFGRAHRDLMHELRAFGPPTTETATGLSAVRSER